MGVVDSESDSLTHAVSVIIQLRCASACATNLRLIEFCMPILVGEGLNLPLKIDTTVEAKFVCFHGANNTTSNDWRIVRLRTTI
jgi:hypothetical protein